MVEDEKREGIKSRDFIRQEEICATLLDSVTAIDCGAGCFLCFPPGTICPRILLKPCTVKCKTNDSLPESAHKNIS